MLELILTNKEIMFKKIILTLGLFLFSTNLFAAQTQIAQVNGMMCIKCQKMVTKALQAASPNATVKVSWPEGVAVSSFEDKSNLSDEDYKNAFDKAINAGVKMLCYDCKISHEGVKINSQINLN